jgi:acyl-CoA synthetase (AMP-forming)/AMP-acid ligase II
VFAADSQRFGKAIQAAVPERIEVVLSSGGLDGRSSTPFVELLATPITAQVDAAMQATGPDTITKFLFTSGSTKLPKAVINTHRMWCANQQQMAQSMPVHGAKRRWCCWTGCRGTTPLAATTTLAWCCTTAARSTSTMASPPRP